VQHLDASKVGVQGVKATLQDLATAATNLADAAKDQFATQSADLRTALGSLQTTITGLTDQNSLSSKLGAITASVSGVEHAAQQIASSAKTTCPSVPPTS
jgi:hypothetical protein